VKTKTFKQWSCSAWRRRRRRRRRGRSRRRRRRRRRIRRRRRRWRRTGRGRRRRRKSRRGRRRYNNDNGEYLNTKLFHLAKSYLDFFLISQFVIYSFSQACKIVMIA
jgi:hypothetical protein